MLVNSSYNVDNYFSYLLNDERIKNNKQELKEKFEKNTGKPLSVYAKEKALFYISLIK